MRFTLATDLISRDGTTSKDAQIKNAYVEINGEQRVVRKRPAIDFTANAVPGEAQGMVEIDGGIIAMNGDNMTLIAYGSGGGGGGSGGGEAGFSLPPPTPGAPDISVNNQTAVGISINPGWGGPIEVPPGQQIIFFIINPSWGIWWGWYWVGCGAAGAPGVTNTTTLPEESEPFPEIGPNPPPEYETIKTTGCGLAFRLRRDTSYIWRTGICPTSARGIKLIEKTLNVTTSEFPFMESSPVTPSPDETISVETFFENTLWVSKYIGNDNHVWLNADLYQKAWSSINQVLLNKKMGAAGCLYNVDYIDSISSVAVGMGLGASVMPPCMYSSITARVVPINTIKNGPCFYRTPVVTESIVLSYA